MPRGCSTGATKTAYTLEDGVWLWKVLESGEAFKQQKFTEEGYTKNGDEKIQLVVKVGDRSHNIIVIETLSFGESSEWKLNEFLKSAGIYPGEGVPYNLTARMCVDLVGKCRTRNKQTGDYTNTNISDWLEAPEQHPENIPGFLGTEDDTDRAAKTTDEPDYTDSIPFNQAPV